MYMNISNIGKQSNVCPNLVYLSSFFSKHILLFFPNRDPPATVAELENHPVISKLREAFRIGAKNCNSRYSTYLGKTRHP